MEKLHDRLNDRLNYPISSKAFTNYLGKLMITSKNNYSHSPKVIKLL